MYEVPWYYVVYTHKYTVIMPQSGVYFAITTYVSHLITKVLSTKVTDQLESSIPYRLTIHLQVVISVVHSSSVGGHTSICASIWNLCTSNANVENYDLVTQLMLSVPFTWHPVSNMWDLLPKYLACGQQANLWGHWQRQTVLQPVELRRWRTTGYAFHIYWAVQHRGQFLGRRPVPLDQRRNCKQDMQLSDVWEKAIFGSGFIRQLVIKWETFHLVLSLSEIPIQSISTEPGFLLANIFTSRIKTWDFIFSSVFCVRKKICVSAATPWSNGCFPTQPLV